MRENDELFGSLKACLVDSTISMSVLSKSSFLMLHNVIEQLVEGLNSFSLSAVNLKLAKIIWKICELAPKALTFLVYISENYEL